MQPTLAKIKTLERFLQSHGDDAYIASTLAKMLEYKIQKYDDEIATLQTDLRELENKYAMTSPDFFSGFSEAIWVMTWTSSSGRPYTECI